ncbi:hypothetical protein FQA39_LY05965 [Lamprigera yunnana]|nr:hypothetical protein FQA39_LY05965 [Lamprigera yunnana]
MEISRDSEFVAIKNLNKLCRICLQETNMMTDISEIDRKTNLSFAEMIRNCTNKEVKEDGLLPQLICHICKEELIHAMNFQLKYNNSYKFFIEYLLNVNAEKIVDDQLLIINITEHENNGVAAFGEDCEKAYQNEEIFNCEMCTQSFSSEVERRNHQSVCKHYIRKMVICSRNNVAVPVQNHRVRLLKHSVRFNCKVCGKIFSTNYNLKRHSNIHTKVKPYACKMCNARFGRHETLEEHHSLHTDLRCGSCGQDFKTGVECNEDMFRDKCTNRYQRMLSCNICSKTYTLRKSLRIHKLLHTDNCIICPQCGKLYANEEKLKVHVSIVHQKDGFIKPNETVIIEVPAEFQSSRTLLAARKGNISYAPRKLERSLPKSPQRSDERTLNLTYKSGNTCAQDNYNCLNCCPAHKHFELKKLSPQFVDVRHNYNVYYVFVDNIPEYYKHSSSPMHLHEFDPSDENNFSSNQEFATSTPRHKFKRKSSVPRNGKPVKLRQEPKLIRKSCYYKVPNKHYYTSQSDAQNQSFFVKNLDEKHDNILATEISNESFQSLLNATPQTYVVNDLEHSSDESTCASSTSRTINCSNSVKGSEESFMSLLSGVPYSQLDSEGFQSLLNEFFKNSNSRSNFEELLTICTWFNALNQLDKEVKKIKSYLSRKLHMTILKAVPIFGHNVYTRSNRTYGSPNSNERNFVPVFSSTQKSSPSQFNSFPNSTQYRSIGGVPLREPTFVSLENSASDRSALGASRIPTWKTPPCQRTYDQNNKFNNSRTQPTYTYPTANNGGSAVVDYSCFAPPISSTRNPKWGNFNYSGNLPSRGCPKNQATTPSSTSVGTFTYTNSSSDLQNETSGTVPCDGGTDVCTIPSEYKHLDDANNLTCGSLTHTPSGRKVTFRKNTTSIQTCKKEQETVEEMPESSFIKQEITCPQKCTSNLSQTVNLDDLKEIEAMERRTLECNLRNMQEARRQLAINASKIGAGTI